MCRKLTRIINKHISAGFTTFAFCKTGGQGQRWHSSGVEATTRIASSSFVACNKLWNKISCYSQDIQKTVDVFLKFLSNTAFGVCNELFDRLGGFVLLTGSSIRERLWGYWSSFIISVSSVSIMAPAFLFVCQLILTRSFPSGENTRSLSTCRKSTRTLTMLFLGCAFVLLFLVKNLQHLARLIGLRSCTKLRQLQHDMFFRPFISGARYFTFWVVHSIHLSSIQRYIYIYVCIDGKISNLTRFWYGWLTRQELFLFERTEEVWWAGEAYY